MDLPLEILKNIKEIKYDYDQLKNIKKKPEIIKELGKKYPQISDNYPALFSLVFNPVDCWEKDIKKLEEMANLANKVKNKEISQHDASVKIGGKLCDEYVKPALKKT